MENIKQELIEVNAEKETKWKFKTEPINNNEENNEEQIHEYDTESMQEEVELKEEGVETNVENQTSYKMEGI